jgi:hypothetical protein
MHPRERVSGARPPADPDHTSLRSTHCWVDRKRDAEMTLLNGSAASGNGDRVENLGPGEHHHAEQRRRESHERPGGLKTAGVKVFVEQGES